MKVYIIGNGLTALSLAKNLINKNIKVINYTRNNNKLETKTRTIGISRDSLDFFNKEIIKLRKNITWEIKKIDIYTEKYRKQKILNFEQSQESLFSIFKNDQVYKYLEENLKKNKLFKKILFKNNYQFLRKAVKIDHDLIINCDANNIITKELFFRKINKNYNSKAFTTIIKHKKIINNIASQIFTKIGPMAFLPISNYETSVVFSANIKEKKLTDKEILKFIKFYNHKYKILNLSKIEKFDLSFSLSRNYFYKNVLAFGDVIHRVHPLVGQGFNITIRDIKILSQLIQKRIDLGLHLDNSIFQEFENKTKHLNYVYTSAIDFVYEFFKLDNKVNNNISKELFKLVNKNKNINNFFSKYANEGLVL